MFLANDLVFSKRVVKFTLQNYEELGPFFERFKNKNSPDFKSVYSLFHTKFFSPIDRKSVV